MQQQFDEKNRELLININGELLHRDEAGISPFDSAVQGGGAGWEGLRLFDGGIFQLRGNLARLRRSGEALGLTQISAGGKILGEIKRTPPAHPRSGGGPLPPT